ncbi:hypothetical protein PAXRUDRAFT_136251 [Paxillus rubicundulus Ve08.2h10]|uniref:Unplaced genomic scaffold scaffold_112, whole genome shotgun sequence n=1 Tax=Paxillus rubicundulus Ve08.2h10 TaxID=930991 RepID=A0A0D0EBE1_9AGAM|nr:hypothetical protein PAXRUDRAFT_136251 [Paxillus rubicundulus Ve08.2h10]
MANHEAADALNPNTTSIGTMKPASTSYRLPNRSKGVKGKRGKGQREDRVSASATSSLGDNGGDEVCHIILLKGEECGKQSSGHVHKMGMHLE